MLYLKVMSYSSGANLLFRSTSSFTLSFSSFSSCSSERLLMSSVNAASCIISKGVSLSFFNNSDHLDCASRPNIQSQSGLAREPGGALAYLGLFFFSPDSWSSSLTSWSFLFLRVESSCADDGLTNCFFSSLELLLLSPPCLSSSSSSTSSPDSCCSSDVFLAFLSFSSCFRLSFASLYFLVNASPKVTFFF